MFRKFDVYRKTVDGVTKQTRIGGAVSLVSFLIVSLLVVSELRGYLDRDLVSRMVVDSAIEKSVVQISFDLVFNEINCKRISFNEESHSNNKLLTRKREFEKRTVSPQGCNVLGTTYAESVNGYLKLTIGNDPNSGEDQRTDLSHKINYFVVSPESLSKNDLMTYGSDMHNPLMDQNTTLSDSVMLYQYHLQIVPTNLRLMSRDEPLALSQYSVYERKIERVQRDSFVLNGHNIPLFNGVVFTYEFYPVTVMMEERQEGFFEFLINLCAIVGGTIAVLGLLNIGIHQSAKTLIGKND